MAIKNIDSLTGTEKAAILIMQLQDDAVNKVLKSMDINEITQISMAMSNLGSVPLDISNVIIDEAYNYLQSDKNVVGSFSNTKDILTKALGEEEAQEVINTIDPNVWRKLSKLKTEQLYQYLQNENPQVIALILHKLPNHTVSEVITKFPSSLATEILIRIAELNPINQQILHNVEETIKKDFDVILLHDNSETIAHLLDNLNRKSRTEYLNEIERKNPLLAESVKQHMFGFESISEINDNGIQTIFRHADKNTLATALKGADDNMQSLFFKNMSERAANIMRDDMEDQGPIGMDQIESAQHEIAKVAKRLLIDNMIKRKLS